MSNEGITDRSAEKPASPAEEAMDRIGTVLEDAYAGNIATRDALNQIALIRGAYLMMAGQ